MPKAPPAAVPVFTSQCKFEVSARMLNTRNFSALIFPDPSDPEGGFA